MTGEDGVSDIYTPPPVGYNAYTVDMSWMSYVAEHA